MKRSEPTLDDQIRSIHYKYEIPQDKAEALLSSGLRFLEIDKAALFSILAEVPIDTILDMRKDDPWGRIQKKLGLTAALYEERLLRHRARRLHRFYGIPEDRAIPLRAKIVSLTLLWLTSLHCILLLFHPWWLKALMLAVAAGITVYITSFKTRRSHE